MVVQSVFQNIDRAIFISSNCHWYCLIINAAAHHHIFTKILFLEKDDVLPYYHSDVRNFLCSVSYKMKITEAKYKVFIRITP